MAVNIDLTEAGGARFWSIYEAYQKDLGQLNRQREEYLFNRSEFPNAQSRAVSLDESRRGGGSGLAADLLKTAANKCTARTNDQGGK